jgi:acyl transferase domain-containing protein
MTTKTAITSPAVFLVSGGAKGITAQCAIKLAKNQPCKFILLGRSALLETEPEWAKNCFEEPVLKKRIMEHLIVSGEKPTPIGVQKIYNKIASSREIKQNLAEIKQTGAEVEYLDVDVTNTAELTEKLTKVVERIGNITGVIHGAGNLADKLIEKKTEQDFEKVYSTKVQGLENILACVNPSQLKHLVLFSSIAGFYGNIGQADYALANEVLNKSAHLIKQKYPECHVVAINWGGWDSGMVTPELKKEFARRGIEIIPVDVGTQMLVRELNPKRIDTTQVIIGSPLIPPAAPLTTELKTYRLRRKLTLEANPFLHDHVIAGNPVLPATCASSWISDSCQSLYPGYKTFLLSDFRFLKGITFNETLADEYFLDLEEISKNINTCEIEFVGKIWSKTPEGKIKYHFSARTKLMRDIPEAPTYESLNLIEDNIITDTGKSLYQNGDLSLFHGLSFQGIKRVINITPEKITTECFWQDIGKVNQGQFPIDWVNGFATDLSTHPLWIWLTHFHQEVCLPGQQEAYEQFARIPCNESFYVSCEVRDKKPSSISADFFIHDINGKIYSQIIGTKGIILPLKLMQGK